MSDKKIGVVAACLVAASAVIVGCRTPNGGEVQVARTNDTYAVVVGVENSRMFGECPGAKYDSDRMAKLISKYAKNTVVLQNGNATKTKVMAALKKAVADAGTGLVVFYYSGHGGSDPFPDTGIEEKDGSDEYLCLWDTYLRDNDIWKIITASKGRFFMISDSCHSQTQFRNPVFRLTPPLSFDHRITMDADFSMLCWSGCPDSDYSYGASTGGKFTNTLLKHFASNKTYEYLWNEIKNDKGLLQYENPQSTVLGDGFTAKPMFR